MSRHKRTHRTANSSLQMPCLVLNASYEVLCAVPVRRAMTLIVKGVAVQQEVALDKFVRSYQRSTPVPTVIRLLNYRKVPRNTRTVSRKNILIRDGFTCLYCGEEFPSSELTLDHILPKSRGGASSWENLGSACYSCNNAKGSRTPEEAGMPLLRIPRPFNIHTSRHLVRALGKGVDHAVWDKYMFA